MAHELEEARRARSEVLCRAICRLERDRHHDPVGSYVIDVLFHEIFCFGSDMYILVLCTQSDTACRGGTLHNMSVGKESTAQVRVRLYIVPASAMLATLRCIQRCACMCL